MGAHGVVAHDMGAHGVVAHDMGAHGVVAHLKGCPGRGVEHWTTAGADGQTDGDEMHVDGHVCKFGKKYICMHVEHQYPSWMLEHVFGNRMHCLQDEGDMSGTALG